MSLRRLRAIFLKEFRHITRDLRSLIMALAVPLVMLLLFGVALSLDVDRIPTLVYDASRSAESRELIRQFQGSRYFEIRGIADDYRAIEAGIDGNRILLGIAIPPDYARHIRSGERAEVQFLLDGSDSNTASIALGYVESLVRAYSFQLRSDAQMRKAGQPLALPVDTSLRVWYNTSLQSRNYVVPGLIAVILMIIAALLTSLTIAREREMGTLEQLLSTPVRPAELALGKMLAYCVVGALDVVIAVIVGIFVFGVPFRGSLLLLAGASVLFLICALFWGVMISAYAKNQVEAYQAGFITSFLPAFLLSGFVYSIENMPKPIQAISHIFPGRYFVTALKGIFLKGVGLEVLWVEMAFLAAYGAIVFLLATRALQRKMS